MLNQHYKCKDCNKIYYTYDLMLKHLNETASADGTKVHKIEELQGMPY